MEIGKPSMYITISVGNTLSVIGDDETISGSHRMH